MDFDSGVVGATTMVVPKVSGSCMVLVLGQYDRVVRAVDDFSHLDFGALWIVAPVGIGAVLGVAGLSNLLKWLLHRHEKATLGLLLGILLGSVLGLWLFSQGQTEKILDRRTDAELDRYAEREGIAGAADLSGDKLVAHIQEHWPNRTAARYSTKGIAQTAVSLVVGLGVTLLIGRLGSPTGVSNTRTASL